MQALLQYDGQTSMHAAKVNPHLLDRPSFGSSAAVLSFYAPEQRIGHFGGDDAQSVTRTVEMGSPTQQHDILMLHVRRFQFVLPVPQKIPNPPKQPTTNPILVNTGVFLSLF